MIKLHSRSRSAWFAAVFSVCLFVALSGCRTPGAHRDVVLHEFSSPQMGTLFTIRLYAESSEVAEAAAEAAFDRVAQLEDILSDYIADSELSRLSKAPVRTPVNLSADLAQVLERANSIADLTDGAFDITAGPYTRLWRFSVKQKRLPSEEELRTAAKAVGWTNLVLKGRTATLATDGMRLDPGGIGKGFAADEAMKVLHAHGIDRALIAAGGDLRVSRPPPGKDGWTVTIGGTGPDEARSADRTLLLRDAGVSTSGDTEQFIELDGVRYSHIVNPFTGLGLTNGVQATVIAPDATTSDALATASCVLGSDERLARIEALADVTVILRTNLGRNPEATGSDQAP